MHSDGLHPVFVEQDDTATWHTNDDAYITPFIVTIVQPVLLNTRQLWCLVGLGQVKAGSISG